MQKSHVNLLTAVVLRAMEQKVNLMADSVQDRTDERSVTGEGKI